MMKSSRPVMALLLVLSCSPTVLRADDDGLGKGAASYLGLGMGARALGLGGAYTAVAADASAIYWNPAGLSEMEHMEFFSGSASMDFDRSYYYTSFVFPFRHIEDSLLNAFDREER